ncbi:MAG: response regulator, partial [Pseudomonadota bacterium]
RQLRQYDVTPCNSGSKALELLRQQTYDIVLCDLMMPGLTGMDLFEEVERFDAGLAGRIVFMTGGVFTDRAAEFLASVENPRIEKPVHGKRLSELAEAARSSRSNAS